MDLIRRWHISLSTWFRDYVYIPLGGNRRGDFRRYLNLFITFTLSGLWHGAAWTFVIWGILHGLFVIFENIALKLKTKLRVQEKNRKWNTGWLRIAVTFSFVCFAWIFFRANSVSDAIYAVSHLMPTDLSAASIIQAIAAPGVGKIQLCVILLAMSILLAVEWIRIWGKDTWVKRIFDRYRVFRWICYIGLIVLLMTFGIGEDGFDAAFIYFQF